MDQRQRRGTTASFHIPGKDDPSPSIGGALEHLSTCGYLMAAAHEGRRAAVMARSVGVCGDAPPMVCCAVRKGHWIGPLIRDSHRFSLSQVSHEDRLVLRKFAEDASRGDNDALEWLALETLEGLPTLAKSEVALVCEVVRRIDLEAGHELLVGQVIAARVAAGREQLVRLHTEASNGDLRDARDVTSKPA